MLSDKHLDETIEQEQLKHVLQTLFEEKKIILENSHVAIPSLYYSELKVFKICIVSTHTKITLK